MRRVHSATAGARVCVRVAAAPRGTAVALAGDFEPGYTSEVAGQPLPTAKVRFDYMRPGRESWYQLLPTIAHRFSIAKAGFLRDWEWVAALALVVAAAFLALRTVLRSVEASERRAWSARRGEHGSREGDRWHGCPASPGPARRSPC